MEGDSITQLRIVPAKTIDIVMTSPPYWGKRVYANGGIGEEKTYQAYVRHLLAICAEVKRVLKPTGSFWLNLGDSYQNKQLLGIPWRVALALTD